MTQDVYHKGPYTSREAAIRRNNPERGKSKVIYLTVHCCKMHKEMLEGYWLYVLNEKGEEIGDGPDKVIKECFRS